MPVKSQSEYDSKEKAFVIEPPKKLKKGRFDCISEIKKVSKCHQRKTK